MKRKCVITVKGEDGKSAVNISFKFYPPLIDGDKQTSGFNHMVTKILKALPNGATAKNVGDRRIGLKR